MGKKICGGVVLCLLVFAGCASASKKATNTDLGTRVSTLEQQVQMLEQQQGSIEKMLVGQTRQMSEYKKKHTAGSVYSNKDIQTALKNAGYYTGTIDGKIGPKTRNAIMKFQEEHGLKVDGVVGKGTWELLGEYLKTN